MRTIHRRGIMAGLAAAGLLAATRAWAWPDRAMRIVMPFAPGGHGDLTTRIAAVRLGTPAPVLARLQAGLIATLADSGTQARLLALGCALATPAQQRPEGFIPYLEAAIAKGRRGVEIAGLKSE